MRGSRRLISTVMVVGVLVVLRRRVHHMEDRYGKKRKSVRRDTPIVEHDAFTREQILKARGMM